MPTGTAQAVLVLWALVAAPLDVFAHAAAPQRDQEALSCATRPCGAGTCASASLAFSCEQLAMINSHVKGGAGCHQCIGCCANESPLRPPPLSPPPPSPSPPPPQPPLPIAPHHTALLESFVPDDLLTLIVGGGCLTALCALCLMAHTRRIVETRLSRLIHDVGSAAPGLGWRKTTRSPAAQPHHHECTASADWEDEEEQAASADQGFYKPKEPLALLRAREYLNRLQRRREGGNDSGSTGGVGCRSDLCSGGGCGGVRVGVGGGTSKSAHGRQQVQRAQPNEEQQQQQAEEEEAPLVENSSFEASGSVDHGSGSGFEPVFGHFGSSAALFATSSTHEPPSCSAARPPSVERGAKAPGLTELMLGKAPAFTGKGKGSPKTWSGLLDQALGFR